MQSIIKNFCPYLLTFIHSFTERNMGSKNPFDDEFEENDSSKIENYCDYSPLEEAKINSPHSEEFIVAAAELNCNSQNEKNSCESSKKNEEIQKVHQGEEEQFLNENIIMVNDIINDIIENVIKQVETKILITEEGKSKQFKHCSQSYNNLLSYEKNNKNNSYTEACSTTPGSPLGFSTPSSFLKKSQRWLSESDLRFSISPKTPPIRPPRLLRNKKKSTPALSSNDQFRMSAPRYLAFFSYSNNVAIFKAFFVNIKKSIRN